jgi:hypothetical protein
MLYALDQTNGNTFVIKPENIACINNLYMIEQTTETNYSKDELEKAFAIFDGLVAPVIREINEKKKLPDDEKGYSLLLNFIAFMICRNPIMIEQLLQPMKEVTTISLEMALASKGNYQKLLEGMANNGFDIENYPEYEKVKEFFDNNKFVAEISQNYKLKTIIDSTNMLIPLLAKRKWSLFLTEDANGGFICSDNPVALVPKATIPDFYSPGFAMANTEISMPLSKNVAIIGRFEGVEEVGFATTRVLATINSRTGMYSDRFIFSSTDDFVFLNVEDRILSRVDLIKGIKNKYESI